jgi:uncharacterized protein
MAQSATPWRSYSRYLRERHGRTVYRVPVDAGFGCPNRAGGRAGAGCVYCSGGGGRVACAAPVQDQVEDGIRFLRRRYGAEAFILFFQSYSNTNAPLDALRAVYDAGLALAPFVGLNVATRPDCLDEARADLLASYAATGREVWCELGLQSAHDTTLARIRRGHTLADFVRAFRLLRERGVRIGVHLIFGLPGEGRAEIMATIETLAALVPDGVKIHNLHVAAGTPLSAEYAAGELTVPQEARHLSWVADALERLPAETVIMRLLCDTPRDRLQAPRRGWDKREFTVALERRMREGGMRQGRLYTAGSPVPAAIPPLSLTLHRAGSTLFP